MMRLLIVIGCLVVASSPVFAHDQEGCPQYPDRKPSSFGYTPDVDSALGPTRFGVLIRANQMTIPDESALKPALDEEGDPVGGAANPASVGAWLPAGTGYLQMNRARAIVFGLQFSRAQSRYPHFARNGNLGASVGLRWTKLAYGDALRTGLAFQIGMGASMDGFDQDRDALNRLAARSPFATETFAFDRPITSSIEFRAELVGCHAPFLHLRIGAVGWRADPEQTALVTRDERDHVLAVPMSFAAGYDAMPGFVTVGLQAGLEYRRPVEVLKSDLVGRVRLFLDGRVWKIVHVGGYAGFIHGTIDGVDVGLVVEGQIQ